MICVFSLVFSDGVIQALSPCRSVWVCGRAAGRVYSCSIALSSFSDIRDKLASLETGNRSVFATCFVRHCWNVFFLIYDVVKNILHYTYFIHIYIIS